MDLFPSSITAASQADLIARFRRHDPAAAVEVFERYGKLLFSLILNIVGDRQNAEDLLAEVLLLASNNLHAFEAGNMDFGTWLLILARNHSLRFRGDSVRSKEQPQHWKALEAVAAYQDASHPATATASQQAFQALPEVTRLILELAWFEGMGLQEISSHLNVPVSEVVALATSSLAQIREY